MQLWTALMLGFLGSFHCVGMCGPIAMSIPRDNNHFWPLTFNALLYNSGRVLTYTLLGLIFGLIGTRITIAGFQSWLSIILGLGVIFGVIISKYKGSLGSIPLVNGFIHRFYSKVIRSESSLKLPMLGVLNGLLPCAFVYTGLAAAVLTPTISHSMLFMLLFGIGTFPAMYMMYLAPSFLSINLRHRINRLVPYLALVLGVFLIIRGIALQDLAISEILNSGMGGFCIFPGTEAEL
jgi:sulfite exporter TauE/SafE